MRDREHQVGQPVGGVGPTLASQGFVDRCGTAWDRRLSIRRLKASKTLRFNDFTIGVDVTGEPRSTTPTSGADSSRTSSANTRCKSAAASTSTRSTSTPTPSITARFVFQGTETGSDFADYLLGIASTYRTGRRQPVLSAQSLLRALHAGQLAREAESDPQLRITLGRAARRGARSTTSCKPSCLASNRRSIPERREGIVFPGDPGIPDTLAPTKWTNFAPRLGLAYSPDFQNGLLGNIFGDSGKSTHSRRIRHVLHRVRRIVGRHHERLRALWIRLHQHWRRRPVARTLCHCHQWSQSVRPAFSRRPSPRSALRRAIPNNTRRLVPVRPHHRRCRRSITITSAVHRELHALAGSANSTGNTYPQRRVTSASQAHHLLVLTSANPGNRRRLPQREPARSGHAGHRNLRTFQRRRDLRHADGRRPFMARGPVQRRRSMASPIRRRSASPITTRCRSTAPPAAGRWSSWPATPTANRSTIPPVWPSRCTRSIPSSTRAHLGLRHAPQLRRQLQLQPAFRTLFRHDEPLDQGWALSGITRFASGLPVTLYNNTDSSLLGKHSQRH